MTEVVIGGSEDQWSWAGNRERIVVGGELPGVEDRKIWAYHRYEFSLQGHSLLFSICYRYHLSSMAAPSCNILLTDRRYPPSRRLFSAKLRSLEQKLRP